MINRVLVISVILLTCFANVKSQVNEPLTGSDSLVVVWSSGDIDVAEKVCLMYTHAAKKNQWFKEVVLIVWGPSAKLLAENEALQKKIAAMQKDGIKMEACIACAGQYGVTDKLKSLGIDVKPMGGPLTDYLKSGRKMLTF
jgi:hypothetical protein